VIPGKPSLVKEATSPTRTSRGRAILWAFARKRPIFSLSCVWGLLFPVWLGPVSATEDATREAAFSWQVVPASAVLERKPPFMSDCFRYVDSSEKQIHLRFEWETGRYPYPTQGERFHSLVVTPAGGILSSSCESAEIRYLKSGNLVTPTTHSIEADKKERLKIEFLGEYRGAELVRIEFRPTVPVYGHPEVDTSFISTATLTLNLKNPFHDPRPVDDLVLQAFRMVVVNPENLPRCLPRLDEQKVIDSNRLAIWRQPAVKIRTSSDGWYGIPVSRLKPLLGESTRMETLHLSRRAPLIETAAGSRDPNDETRIYDTQESFGIQARKNSGGDGESQDFVEMFVFHADLSSSFSDPLECYWLTTGTTEASQDRIQGPGMYSIGLPSSMAVTTATVESVVGKDRVFIDGGLRTHEQANFWVDCEFPKESNESLKIPLPKWINDATQPIEGRLRVMTGSSMKEVYSAEDQIKAGELALSIGAPTMAYTLEKHPDGYGVTVCFQIPQGVTGEVLTIRHTPGTPLRNPLYFNDLHLRGTTPMIWSGTDVIYKQPSSSRIAIIDRCTDGVLPLAFGKTQKGEWMILDAHRNGQQIVLLPGLLQGGSFTELHLIRSLKEVDELVPFHLPAWVNSPPQVQQLVIAPSFFQKEVNALITDAAARGLRYAFIDLGEVFDLFSGGQFSPFAVRNFLTWVEKTWPDPQPSSALMVGDSSWDTWRHFPQSKQIPNWTPSYHTPQHPDYASDFWFVEGPPRDRIANWFFGRMPCQTTRQLEGYLHKLAMQGKHGTSPRLIWVTDDNPPFERNTEDVYLQALPLSFRLDHIRIRDYPFVDNFYYGVHLAKIREEARKTSAPLDYGKISPACNETIRKSINKGTAVFVYFGHSGLNVLGHERVLFGGGSKFSDIPSLTNLEQSPLAFLMTCDVGRYDFVEIPKWSIGLAEEMLFHGEGGCMALFTSTGRGLPSDHLGLLKGSLDLAIRGEVHHPGAIMWGGKVECLQSGIPNQSVDMFTLLGDPLYRCPLPESRSVRPVRIRWNRNGTLELRMDVSPLLEDHSFRSSKTVSCWQVGDDLREENSWEDLPVNPDGTVQLTLPKAHDLEKVLLGISPDVRVLPADQVRDDSVVGTLAFDLNLFKRPDWTVSKEEGAKPDLTLDIDRVLFENYSPRNGETIFIRAMVMNEGHRTAEDVTVKGFAGPEKKPLLNFANFPETKIRRLDPGQTETVRLRWDWWEGTGNQTVMVKVDPDNAIAEISETNNGASKTIHILEKADLGWGLIRDVTSAQVDFSRVTAVPADWVIDPTKANLGPSAPFRALLHNMDRAAIIEVPLSNFGETSSSTTTLEIQYWREGESKPVLSSQAVVIPPIQPALGGLHPKRVPVLLVPQCDRVEIEVDPDGGVDERTRNNNTLKIVPPEGFWDRMPVLRQQRTAPKTLERFRKS